MDPRLDPRSDPSVQYDARSSLIPHDLGTSQSPSKESFNQPSRPQAYSGKRRYYQPTITRLPALLSLLALTLGLVAVIEYAVIKLPNHDSDGVFGSIANKTVDTAKEIFSARDVRLILRQTTIPAGATALEGSPSVDVQAGGSPVTPVTSVAAPSNSIPDVAGVAGPISLHLPTNPRFAKPTNFLPIVDGSTPTPIVIPTAAPSDPLPVKSKGDGTSAAPSANLPVGNVYLPTADVKSVPVSTTAPSADLPFNKILKPEVDPPGNAQPEKPGSPGDAQPEKPGSPGDAQPEKPGSPGNGSPTAADTTNYLPLAGGHNPTSTPKAIHATATSPNHLPVGETTVGAVLSGDSLPVDTRIYSTAAQSNYISTYNPYSGDFTTSGTIDGFAYAVITSGVVVDGHTYATATPTTVNLGNGTPLVINSAGNAAVGNSTIPTTRQQSIHALTVYQYVTGGILPTLIAVIFIIPWPILDSAIKEMEPYYQLKSNDGASVADSLCMNYATSITALSVFKSARKGHFTVLWSSLIAISVLLLAPLSSEAIYIGFIGKCTATSGRQACIPRVSVYPLAARLMQAILCFIAVLTFLLAISITRRKSGVYASPLCIAATASFMQNPQLLTILRSLDPDTPDSKTLAHQLIGCRFRLTHYADHSGQRSYGIVPSTSHYEPPNTHSSFRGSKYKYTSVHVTNEEIHLKTRRPSWTSYFSALPLTLLALLVTATLALIITYSLTSGNNPLEHFMDSQSFGPRFLFTSIGVVIKLYFSSLDNESQRLEPYHTLIHAPSPPTTLLHLAHSSPFTGLYHLLSPFRLSTAVISTLAILCDPLTVALSNIPFAPGLPFMTYRASTYLSIGILGLMLLTVIYLLLRNPMPRLVRVPDCLGSGMLYLAGSGIVRRLEGVAEMNGKERDGYVRGMGGRFGFERRVGEDEVSRWGVWEVEEG